MENIMLIAVDVMGFVKDPGFWFSNVEEAKAKYKEYDLEMNEHCIDHRSKYAIHALCGHKRWPQTIPCVKSDVGTAPDRSCRSDRCDCERLGFPIKKHPHVIDNTLML